MRRTTLVSHLVTLAVASAIFVALFRGIHHEMKSRRRTEVGLLEANRFPDSLIENLPVMILLKDAETLKVIRQNRAFNELIGYPPMMCTLVEDSDADAEMTMRALRKGNVINKLVRVRDGVEALEFVFHAGAYKNRNSGNPRLILLDLKMPRMDGIEVPPRPLT